MSGACVWENICVKIYFLDQVHQKHLVQFLLIELHKLKYVWEEGRRGILFIPEWIKSTFR